MIPLFTTYLYLVIKSVCQPYMNITADAKKPKGADFKNQSRLRIIDFFVGGYPERSIPVIKTRRH